MLWGDGRRKSGRLSLSTGRVGGVLLVVLRWDCQLAVGLIMRID